MWIYKPTKDNSSRFVLGEKGARPLICFGINSSTAEPDKLDNTLRQVQLTAQSFKYDGWIMLNIYPQRATDPNNMHERIDTSIHKKNLYHIKQIFKSHPTADTWAAWGSLINKRPFLKECLMDIAQITEQFKPNWLNKGALLKEGHPHHPLYLRKDAPFKSFDIRKYLGSLINEIKN